MQAPDTAPKLAGRLAILVLTAIWMLGNIPRHHPARDLRHGLAVSITLAPEAVR
jgi:hypothetical protein